MDAQWLDPVDLRVVDDAGPRPIFETLRAVTFYSAYLQREITVPAGYQFDGASIPQPAMAFTGWPGVRAALLHDWCCTSRVVERVVGDRLFLEALRVGGTAEGVAVAMFGAVSAYTHAITFQPDPPPYQPGGIG